MKPAVQINNVSHVYVTKKEATLAVEHVNLSLYQGEFVSLLGPSGCGKTTILSMVAGLMKPTQGDIQINGELITGPSAHVGYMLQQDYLFPWRSIYENAVIGLELMGTLTEEKKQYTLHLLKEMGLFTEKDYYPHQLSGGMRQRVALVRTLATEPEILLLDEPFSALDYRTKLQLEDLVVATLKAHKKTALLVTHDISEAIAMSDRIVILDRNPGRVNKQFTVPLEISKELPIHSREQRQFQTLFHQIWQEFEDMEKKGGVEN